MSLTNQLIIRPSVKVYSIVQFKGRLQMAYVDLANRKVRYPAGITTSEITQGDLDQILHFFKFGLILNKLVQHFLRLQPVETQSN